MSPHVDPPPSAQESAVGNPVFQTVCDELRQRIESGAWVAGERLPSITRLASQFAVSAASIREALRSLQSAGLVSIAHGRGVFVSETRPAPNLSAHFADDHSATIIALAETRRILEPEIAAFAAERATAAELAQIELLARQTDDAARQGEPFVELDVAFHLQITHAARNPVLTQMMNSVNDLLLESRRRVVLLPGQALRSARYHLLIAETIHARNAAQARLLMLAHMNDMVNDVLATER